MDPADYRHLVDRTLAGDTTAFDELLRACRSECEHVVRRYLGSATEIDDILQEAFSQAYLQLRNLKSPERFSEWIRVIVRNRCLSVLRRRGMEISYDETGVDGEVQIAEATQAPSPEENLLHQEELRRLYGALDRLSDDHRTVTRLHYLHGKSYQEMARMLRVSITTIEGRLYRARQQLTRELMSMADMDHEALKHAVEEATKGLKEDIQGLKKQLWAVQREEDSWLEHARSGAVRTMTQLPTGHDRPIVWGILGGYRIPGSPGGSDKRRIAYWVKSSIEEFIDPITDESIASLASHFTDPTAIAIMRRLLFLEQVNLADLPAAVGAEASAVDNAVERLETAGVVKRSVEDAISPRGDMGTYFLTLLSMAHLHRGHDGTPDGSDDASHAIICRVAGDLADNTPHPPPFDKFGNANKNTRWITLFQAIPMSLAPEGLADLKSGGRLAFADLNEAQQDYLKALLSAVEANEYDLDKTTIRLDHSHTRDDDHAHIVVEDGSRSHHIDAYLEDTPRPGWY